MGSSFLVLFLHISPKYGYHMVRQVLGSNVVEVEKDFEVGTLLGSFI